MSLGKLPGGAHRSGEQDRRLARDRSALRGAFPCGDATVGQGGHSFLFGKTLGPEGVIVGFDVDNDAIRLAQSKLEELACKVILVDSNFSHMSEKLHEFGIEKVDFILADLGISSAQLADADFGLSFQTNMPLDMRLDKRLQRTAADILNKEDVKTLADLIY